MDGMDRILESLRSVFAGVEPPIILMDIKRVGFRGLDPTYPIPPGPISSLA